MMHKTHSYPRSLGRLSPAKQNYSGTVRTSWSRRLARSFDRMITVCQEWLEGPDRPLARAAAVAVLIIFAVYLAAHLVLKICRAG